MRLRLCMYTLVVCTVHLLLFFNTVPNYRFFPVMSTWQILLNRFRNIFIHLFPGHFDISGIIPSYPLLCFNSTASIISSLLYGVSSTLFCNSLQTHEDSSWYLLKILFQILHYAFLISSYFTLFICLDFCCIFQIFLITI